MHSGVGDGGCDLLTSLKVAHDAFGVKSRIQTLENNTVKCATEPTSAPLSPASVRVRAFHWPDPFGSGDETQIYLRDFLLLKGFFPGCDYRLVSNPQLLLVDLL